MIDYTRIRSSIESYLKTNYTETLIEYQNVPLSNNDVREYIKIEDEDIDTDLYHTGILIIRIFTSVGIGTDRSKQIASILSSLIGMNEVDGIVFKQGILRNIPQDNTNSVYFVQELSFEYYDEGQKNNC